MNLYLTLLFAALTTALHCQWLETREHAERYLRRYRTQPRHSELWRTIRDYTDAEVTFLNNHRHLIGRTV